MTNEVLHSNPSDLLYWHQSNHTSAIELIIKEYVNESHRFIENWLHNLRKTKENDIVM